MSAKAPRREKDSPSQAAVRALHARVSTFGSEWKSINGKLANQAQAAINAHLELGFANNSSMGALNSFGALQDRLSHKLNDTFQRRIDDMTASIQQLLELVVSLSDARQRVLDLCTDSAPLFKTASPAHFVEWASNFLRMFTIELQLKQSILIAFGGPDLISSNQSVTSIEFSKESSIRGASELNAAAAGRLDVATEDTLTMYLDAVLLEPYVEPDLVGVVLDSFAYELG